MTDSCRSTQGLLTVVTLVLNEQRDLPGMLDSVPPSWAIIIADGGSRDTSLAIAQSRSCRIVEQDLEAINQAGGNFDVARNAAAATASTDWILFLDADERLTPDLVTEIELRLSEETLPQVAFSVPRTNLFWGKPGRILGEDRHIRLVRNGTGTYEGTELHRPMQVHGEVGRLNHALVHRNVKSFRDILRRLKRYVPQQVRAHTGHVTLADLGREPIGLFRYYYWRNQAHKDGLRGLAMSMIYALERALILAACWARSTRR